MSGLCAEAGRLFVLHDHDAAIYGAVHDIFLGAAVDVNCFAHFWRHLQSADLAFGVLFLYHWPLFLFIYFLFFFPLEL